MTRYAFRRPWMRYAARVFDAAGHALFRPVAVKGRPAPKNLLIVRLDHLGDVWNITGLPKAVKEHFSDCRVTCLVSSAAAPLLEANPFVDEIIRYDAPWFWKKRKPMATAELLRLLRVRRFDTALSMRGDVREHWLLFRAGIPRRIGPAITGGGFLLTHRTLWREDRHELERVAAVAEPLGLPLTIWKPEIHFTEGEKVRLAGEAGAKGLRAGLPIVGFQIEAGTPAKTWSVDHCAQFLSRLLNRKPEVHVALLGTDGVRADAILRKVGHQLERVHDLTGRSTLRELAAIADRFTFLVAPDSGPAHILSWLGVRTLFLYSGTNRFESWKPLAENTSVMRRPVPCSPCGLRDCAIPGHPCMEDIEPKRVLAAVVERL